MKIFALILVIFAILSICLAALQVTTTLVPKDFSNPAHPGKCVVNKNLILTPGTHPDPFDKCVKYNCNADGTGAILTTSPAGCDPEYIKKLEQSLPKGVMF